ncbi:MAG: efflux RND transporter permease subunit, partial [Deltaproteobacteria bacterium]|nr:efflux RND transporter permease subunit [Deltaproteobacteria bacterium]
MDIIRFSITKPVTTIVGVILVVLFGLIGLWNMPYQLSPDVTEPSITVTTTWRGATPYEVEREIIEEQEKVLKGLPGLVEMESTAGNAMGQITLRFKVGTDLNSALLRVSNKLDEVQKYPDRVDKPVISASGAATEPIVWMFLQTLPDNPRPIEEYRTFFENDVRQFLERVDGISDLFVYGGTEQEMQVVVDASRMAAHGVTLAELLAALDADNVSMSSGDLDIGRRNYRIRTVGEFVSPQDIESRVVRAHGDRLVRVRDLATVGFGFEKKRDAMLERGEPGIVVGVKPEPGVNVLDLTRAVEQVVLDLNENMLEPRGLHLNWVYDQRPYIQGAIDLVKNNILIGGILAVLVLFIFLRSLSSTIIVTLSIPISIIGTFMFMDILGRNLNVISLAGIAFAVGMLVDSAIVVLENIDRHRGMGKRPFDAAYDGVREVWGAVLASSLTTVAVFLPVVFIQEEAGQLFKDIALAVTCAITLSMLVSVLVIPMLANMFFSLSRRKKEQSNGVSAVFGGWIAEGIMTLVRLGTGNVFARFVTIVGLTGAAVALAVAMMPKMEYLPQGNRNLLLCIFIPPPGLSYEEREAVGLGLHERLGPLMVERGEERDKDVPPGIRQTFYVGAESIMLMGIISDKEQQAAELIPSLMPVVNSFPGIFGVTVQAGIFQNELGAGRNIDVDVSGKDLSGLVRTAGFMYGAIMQAIPGAQVRPIPSLEIAYPEVRFLPREQRLKASGMTVTDLGTALDILLDGRKAGEFKQEGEKKIDLIVKGGDEDISSPEALAGALVVTPQGRVVPVSSLAEMERTSGLTEIRHLERMRTITLQVTPPEAVPIQSGMEMIQAQVVDQARQAGLLRGMQVRMSGAADKLVQTWDVLKWNLILAVVITYLLMSALFGNFLYPLVIMFTVPLAAVGGLMGLRLVNLFIAPQPLDLLTMLGFIILI